VEEISSGPREEPADVTQVGADGTVPAVTHPAEVGEPADGAPGAEVPGGGVDPAPAGRADVPAPVEDAAAPVEPGSAAAAGDAPAAGDADPLEGPDEATRRAAAAAQAAADLAAVKEWAAQRAAAQAAAEQPGPVLDEAEVARRTAAQAAADLAAVREWAAQRAAEEQAAAQQAAAERAEVERIATARLAAEEQDVARRAAAEQAEIDRLAAERAAAQQAGSRRAAAAAGMAAEQAALEQETADRVAAEQVAAQRAAERSAAERLAAEGAAVHRAARPAPAPVPRPAERGATAAPVRGRRRAEAPAGRRGGRAAKVLVAALLAVVLVAAGVLLAVDLIGGRGGDPAAPEAEQVPDAVLPELTGPQPVLAALAGTAPVPDPAAVAAALAPLLDAPALGSGLSAQVVDVATGQVLLDRDSADPSTPASTNKLLTSLAALTTLEPTGTIPTTVVAGSAPGEVVLVGGGDPTLSTTAPSTDYPGAATVADLAAQVQTALGGAPVTGVVVDASLFTGPETAPGWGPGDAPSTYAAPVTAAAVDGARVRPGLDPRSGRPATDAGSALAAALGAPGVPVELGTAPAGARTLGRVESAPVSRLVEQALTASDNLLAETLARQVALRRGLPASFDGGAQAVTAALAEAGLDTTGASLVDGSGLSGDDRVPARLLVDVLRGAADGSIPGIDALLSGLPVAGYDGTLAERSADGAGVPAAVRAKTGTLGGVNDLAGTVLTADGRLLAFAVLADGTTGGLVASETALDRVAAALAGCGCR